MGAESQAQRISSQWTSTGAYIGFPTLHIFIEYKYIEKPIIKAYIDPEGARLAWVPRLNPETSEWNRAGHMTIWVPSLGLGANEHSRPGHMTTNVTSRGRDSAHGANPEVARPAQGKHFTWKARGWSNAGRVTHDDTSKPRCGQERNHVTNVVTKCAPSLKGKKYQASFEKQDRTNYIRHNVRHYVHINALIIKE